MTPSDYLSAALLIAGAIFFLAGTLGLLRFPDVYTRLHALTKADNVGLGLVVAGLAVQAESWAAAGKLLLIWSLVLLAGASVAHLVARGGLASRNKAMEAVTLLQWTFDFLLGLGLLWLAWRMLACPDLFEAIVLFVAFGLLMALAWARLDAPDIALAEAAIGAGLTGVLLLASLARLRSTETNEDAVGQAETSARIVQCPGWLPAVVLLLVAAGLGHAVWSLPPYAAGLSAEVAGNLETSGVSNPVTAVLLNFRGYDTLLEMGVLLLALLGVWSLGGTKLRTEAAPGPVLDSLSRLLALVLILVAAYLLWVGAHAPGGAFQAGSALGAVGVLLLLAGWRLPDGLMALPLRLVLVAGPGAFVAMAMLTVLIEGQMLEYPPAQAGILILVLETTATVSIGVTLAALFLGGREGT